MVAICLLIPILLLPALLGLGRYEARLLHPKPQVPAVEDVDTPPNGAW